MYLLLQQLDNRRFVSTTTVFYFWMNLLKVPVYWHAGLIDEGTLWRHVPFAPLVVVGTLTGVALNRRVPGVWFGWIIRLSVFAMGVYLLVR